MSLFIINRYDELKEEQGESQENVQLENLKERIEKRKKARIQAGETVRHPVDIKSIEKDIPSHVVLLDNQESNRQSDNNIDNGNLIVPQFKVLGTKQFEKRTKVKRVLPYWLTNPCPISIDLKQQDTETCIENIHFLESSLKKKMIQDGLKYLFPVQAQVIPWLLQENKSCAFWPRDLCVSAPTGSGKTLTYVLPIIQMLTERVERHIRALVILPVKELVIQVGKVLKDYSVGTNLKVALLTGSIPFTQEQLHIVKYSEISGWQSEADIIVCTAGRLVEHLRLTKGFCLKHLKFLVIDEADRIMDHVQNDWLLHLNKHLQMGDSIMATSAPIVNCKAFSSSCRPPQKLLFSATLSQDPEKLKQWNLFQPKLFSVINTCGSKQEQYKFATPLELSEKYTICGSENKPLVLYNILKSQNCMRVLCFTNSSQAAHRLTVLLSHLLKDDNMLVGELSAAMNRHCRETVLKELLCGKLNILISTDALARGIDVPNCDLVVSYDPPKTAKTYIHRVGRTGRAGREGKALTILLQNQSKPFQDIMKTIGKTNIENFDITQESLQEYSQLYKDAIECLSQKLNDESHIHNKNLKMLKRGRISKTNEKGSKHKKSFVNE